MDHWHLPLLLHKHGHNLVDVWNLQNLDNLLHLVDHRHLPLLLHWNIHNLVNSGALGLKLIVSGMHFGASCVQDIKKQHARVDEFCQTSLQVTEPSNRGQIEHLKSHSQGETIRQSCDTASYDLNSDVCTNRPPSAYIDTIKEEAIEVTAQAA